MTDRSHYDICRFWYVVLRRNTIESRHLNADIHSKLEVPTEAGWLRATALNLGDFPSVHPITI